MLDMENTGISNKPVEEFYRSCFEFLQRLLSDSFSAEALKEKYAELFFDEAISGCYWFQEISERLGLSEFERFAMLLAFTTQTDCEIAKLCKKRTLSQSDGAPDVFLALELFRTITATDIFEWRFSESFHRLTDKRISGTNSPIHLKPAAIQILHGYMPTIAGCECKLYENLPPLLDGESINRELSALVKSAAPESPVVVQLTGDKGSGRKYQLKKLSEQFGAHLMLIDARQLQPESSSLDSVLDELYLMLVMTPSIVCLHDYNDLPHLISFVRKLQEHVVFLCIITDKAIALPDFKQDTLVVALETPALSRMERKSIWENAFASNGLEIPFDIQPLANQYKMSIGDIQKAAHDFSRRRTLGFEPDEIALRKMIEASIHQGTQNGLAKYIRPKFKWDDIVLPLELQDRLREICARMKNSGLVMEGWGFDAKYPYGNGMSVLFYGAPGTGKTMAAHVIASELQTPLYYVDFSNMIDKYIGETEKHIFELFSQARKSGAVLFFDEADALFAKRSQVSDATDRYANAQTACLLQCIDDYDGIVILATNLISNFDDAFKRRIRYFLRFSHPDEPARKRIWQGVFPKSAPVSEEVDFDALARPELSAGAIKNIALTAAYLAVEDGSITFAHLNQALKIEMDKDGKTGEIELFGE